VFLRFVFGGRRPCRLERGVESGADRGRTQALPARHGREGWGATEHEAAQHDVSACDEDLDEHECEDKVDAPSHPHRGRVRAADEPKVAWRQNWSR
jgi:hypothetical protein